MEQPPMDANVIPGIRHCTGGSTTPPQGTVGTKAKDMWGANCCSKGTKSGVKTNQKKRRHKLRKHAEEFPRVGLGQEMPAERSKSFQGGGR